MHRYADGAIVAMAANQQGLVARGQLLDAGLTRHAIDRRVKTGLLRPLHFGVYQVGPIAAPHARELAARLACKGGVISHRSAAAVWQLLPTQEAGDPVDVTLPGSCRRGRRPGIRAHRSSLTADEIMRFEGLDITSRPRTLLDLSTTATPSELERALARAERVDPEMRDRLVGLLMRYPHRTGRRRLRALLDGSSPLPFTRSEAEERLLALIRRSGLPQPQMNVVVHGYEVDCYWRRERFVVEVDGYAYHGSHGAFVRDRRRDGALAAAGIRVMRVSWPQIHEHPERTIVQLAQALVHAADSRVGAPLRSCE